jgi:hypothetical protein
MSLDNYYSLFYHPSYKPVQLSTPSDNEAIRSFKNRIIS